MTSASPKRLTFKAVNQALKTRSGYAGEELVQGNGVLYFSGGNADSWYTSNVNVCRISHTTMESLLADFDHFVRDHAKRTGEPIPTAAPVSVGDALVEMAKAAMLEQLKESPWFKSAPAAARAVEPVITITGIEMRKVYLSVGMFGGGEELRPFVVGRVEVGGVSAKLVLSIAFGGTGLLVLEGE